MSDKTRDQHQREGTPEDARRRTGKIVAVVVSTLLVGHALLGFDCARQWTVTHDEYWHLPVGLLNWKTGRFTHDNLNPPLIRMWAALPLLFTDAVAGESDASVKTGGHGDRFLAANREHYQRYLTLGRMMIVLLSVATGAVLAVWTYEVFGAAAACVAALLWSVGPNVLANAAIVTTDLGASFFFVITLYSLWKYAHRPGWSQTVWFSIWFSLAQLAKFTSLLLSPICFLLWFVVRFRNPKAEPASMRNLLLQWVVIVAIDLVVLNAGYLFQGSMQPLESYRFHSQSMKTVAGLFEWWPTAPVPFPRDYVEGIDLQRRVMEADHPVFLDGEFRLNGFGDYYLKAMWYKLPHSLQLLALLSALYVLLPRGKERQIRLQVYLLTPVVVLLVVGSNGSMQLGLRYMLPVLPFLIMFASQSARWISREGDRMRTIAVTIAIALSALALRHHPHHLAYFNEMSGGPSGGVEHLGDSNIDWGQNLRDLKEYLDSHEIDAIGLAYFGTFPPEELGIEYRLPPSFQPQPGWYAVSVNYLQGRPHIVRNGEGQAQGVGPGEFTYFRNFEPVARIGYSIYVYHLE